MGVGAGVFKGRCPPAEKRRIARGPRSAPPRGTIVYQREHTPPTVALQLFNSFFGSPFGRRF